MSNALTVIKPGAVAQNSWTQEQVELVKRTICKGATNDELMLFMHVAQRTGLDPFARQIHAVKRWNEKEKRFDMTIQVGIDGLRLIAHRTGAYAGSDDPIFDDEREPKKATVTVYKMIQGQRCPFTATARWDEYFPGEKQGFMWKKMPCVMLGKVAEGLALRKAFPAELSGLYTEEEMEQADRNKPVVGERNVVPEQPDEMDGTPLESGEWYFPGGRYKHRKFSELTPEQHRAYIESSEAYFKKIKKPLPAWWDEYLAEAEPVIAMAENGAES